MVWASRIMQVILEVEVLMKHSISDNVFFTQQSNIHEFSSASRYLIVRKAKS